MNYLQDRLRFAHQMQPNRSNLMQMDNNRFMVSSNRLQNVNLIQAATNELGALYLGDIVSILKEDIIKNNKIQAVLSCMYQNVSMQHFVNSHKILSIKDTLDYPIINHLDDAIAWIHQQRKQKYNVLVHCHAGVSRSATIVLAYLIRIKNMNPVQALEYVRSKRGRVKPNINFWNQINEYYTFWLNSTQVPQKRLQKIDILPEHNTLRVNSLSLQPKMIESRLTIDPSIKKDKFILKSADVENTDENLSPMNHKKLINNDASNQKNTLMETSKFSQPDKNISKISATSKDEVNESKGQITKKTLNKRKKIFDTKYSFKNQLKTQPAISQFRHSVSIPFQQPQKSLYQQTSSRQSFQLNSPQSHLYLSGRHPVFNSSIITPSQMYDSYLKPPQSIIIQKHTEVDNRSSIHNFPYNIKISQGIQHASTYHVRQQNNVVSPFAARVYYP